MRRQVPAAALFALLIGCAAHQQPQQQNIIIDADDASPETYALGAMVTESGAVPRDAAGEAFGRGREVFLSVDVASASTDQTIEVEWLDTAGQVVRKETRNVPLGAHYAAFSSGPVITASPGTHRAVVIINGRRVTEKTFRIL